MTRKKSKHDISIHILHACHCSASPLCHASTLCILLLASRSVKGCEKKSAAFQPKRRSCSLQWRRIISAWQGRPFVSRGSSGNKIINGRDGMGVWPGVMFPMKPIIARRPCSYCSWLNSYQLQVAKTPHLLPPALSWFLQILVKPMALIEDSPEQFFRPLPPMRRSLTACCHRCLTSFLVRMANQALVIFYEHFGNFTKGLGGLAIQGDFWWLLVQFPDLIYVVRQ